MASLRGIDLNLLVLFDALYRERQLSAAAASIALSQPAASQALGRLREALGDPLFIRRARGMVPTPVAESLAPSVRSALQTLEQKLATMSEFDPATSRREFRLGLGELGELFYFPRFVARVANQAPNVILRAVPGSDFDQQAAVLRGDLDLAFDFQAPDGAGLEHRYLGAEGFVVIARRAHPRVQGSITLEALLGEPRVRISMSDERWRRMLTALGIPVDIAGSNSAQRVVAVVSQLASAPGIVAETDALALIPRSLLQLANLGDRLQCIEPPLPIELPAYAFWDQNLTSDPGHRWLRSLLTERFWAQP